MRQVGERSELARQRQLSSARPAASRDQLPHPGFSSLSQARTHSCAALNLGAVRPQRGALRQRPRKMPTRRRWLRAMGCISGGVAACGLTYCLFAANDIRGYVSSGFYAGFERLNAQLGLGINQITVTGHRFTSDSDIFDALRLENSRQFLTLDALAARARIEKLPWVQHASVTRVYPGQVRVKVRERAAFALWHRAGDWFLVDRTGHVLSRVDQPLRWRLPVIHGAGAAQEANGLIHLLGGWNDLAASFHSGEWVAERRWSLHLKNGSLVHLPADGAMAALQGLRTRADANEILSKQGQIIDLRKRGYAFVRPKSKNAPHRRLRLSNDQRKRRDG